MTHTDVNAEAMALTLGAHQERGLHVDRRLQHEIHRPGRLSMITLEAADEFFSLVWQAIPDTGAIAPAGQPRSIFDCGSRLASFSWSFRALVMDGHQWFQKCIDIDEGFDSGKFGLIAITPLLADEQRVTPHGTYYVYDGVHKSIVLAKKLLRREMEYRPIEVLLLEPRRH
jgi:hypothetical protein